MMILDPTPAHSPLALLELGAGTEQSLLLVLLVLVLGVLVVSFLALRRSSALSRRLETLEQLGRLEEIQEHLNRVDAERGDLDQRRLEHVLVDVRAGIKRLEASILGVLERQAADAQAERPAQAESPRPVPKLRERVVNRLLALGYSDIRVVTDAAELAELSAEDADGSIVVEVHQGATQLKGRVLLRGGSITDVDLKSFYPIFP